MMTMMQTLALTSLLALHEAAALHVTSSAEQEDDDFCCTVWAAPNFISHQSSYCLDPSVEAHNAYEISFFQDAWRNGSIKCGKFVDATVCPEGGFKMGPVGGQRDFGYTCDNGIYVEHGTNAGAGLDLKSISMPERGGDYSIILNLHPWSTKSRAYLNLDRKAKETILMQKISEDTNINQDIDDNFFDIDVQGVFDEYGDEFDCRNKTVHPQGSIGKVEWKNRRDHAFTGIFKGADTCFVRLSTQVEIITPEEREGDEPVMMSTIAVKCLRDGVDSANSEANAGLNAQASYNYFAAPVFTNLKESGFTHEELIGPIADWIRPHTNFVASLGLSDMALWDQDGVLVDEPIFPYSIKYVPNPDLSYDDEQYDMTLFEHLREVPVGSVLYTAYAYDAPPSMGGELKPIADLVLKSQLETSMWGDTRMYFRHHRHDEDFRYKPEWLHAEDHDFIVLETENVKLHPYQDKGRSSCPFSWLIDMMQ